MFICIFVVNTINLNEQKNVTTQFENTIQNTNEEKAVQKLRVRHLPGDVLSSSKSIFHIYV